MKANILATGPSIALFTPDDTPTFGVNRIAKHHKVDYLVTLDELHTAGTDAKYIVDAKPKVHYSQQYNPDEPITMLDEYERIKVFKFDMLNIGLMEEGVIHAAWWYHSIFTAVCVAFIKGFRDLHLYGADFGPDYLTQCSESELLMAWGNLNTAITKNGGRLVTHSPKSVLREVLPFGCNSSCGPGDYYKEGKCGMMGCYESIKTESV